MCTLQFPVLSFMVSLLILDCFTSVYPHRLLGTKKQPPGLLPVAVAVETYSFKIKNHGLLWVRPWPTI